MPRTNTSRDRILDAATSVFARRGFHQAGMDHIAETAGVAKGTLYYNFPSKAVLFRQVIARGIDHMIQSVRAAAVDDVPIADRLRRILRVQTDVFTDYTELTSILFNELSSGLDAETKKAIRTLRKRYVSFLAELIREGQADGLLQPVDPELAAYTLTHLVYSACDHARHHGTPREAVDEYLTTLVSHGLVKGDRS